MLQTVALLDELTKLRIMFLILGVDHQVQTGYEGFPLEGEPQVFAAILRAVVAAFSPVLIAEEHSVEALRGGYSVAAAVAAEYKIVHLYCDPDKRERRDLGYLDYKQLKALAKECFTTQVIGELDMKAHAIEIARFHPLRESFWLERLKPHLQSDCIFICGDAHIDSFSQTLRSLEVESTVILRELFANNYEKQHLQAARQYINEHPEIRTMSDFCGYQLPRGTGL